MNVDEAGCVMDSATEGTTMSNHSDSTGKISEGSTNVNTSSNSYNDKDRLFGVSSAE